MASLLTADASSSLPLTAKHFERALHWGIQLRLWVALCVTSLAEFTHRTTISLTNRTEANQVLGVIFFSTLALYNLDGGLDTDCTDRQNTSRRFLHGLLTGASLLAVLLLLPYLPARAVLLTVVGLLCCSLYALPFSHQTARRGLKYLPGLKAPFVGTAVASAVVGLLTLTSGKELTLVSLLLWGTLSTYCTANALLFDIPDLVEDELSCVPTLARQNGVTATQTRALLLAILALLAWPSGILILFGWSGLFTRAGQLFAISSLGAFLAISSRFVTPLTSKSRVAWIVDGGLLLPISIWGLHLAAETAIQ